MKPDPDRPPFGRIVVPTVIVTLLASFGVAWYSGIVGPARPVKPETDEARRQARIEDGRSRREMISALLREIAPKWQLKAAEGLCFDGDPCDILISSGPNERVVSVVFKTFVGADGNEIRRVYPARPTDHRRSGRDAAADGKNALPDPSDWPDIEPVDPRY